MKTEKIITLSAYFLPDTFVVDLPDQVTDVIASSEQTDPSLKHWIEAYKTDKYSALYHMGFREKQKWFAPSLEFLYKFAELLIRTISHQPDIEFVRENVNADLTDENLHRLKDELPFVVGMEYVDNDWLRSLWQSLFAVFRSEIESFEGTVAQYFAENNASINVAGRVFFHLVENQDDEFPFAFMATYSTKPVKSKRVVHTPLKHALKEFDGDEKKLLSLISAVVKVAEKSVWLIYDNFTPIANQ